MSKRPRRAPAPTSATRPSPYRYRTVVEDGIRYPGEYHVYDRESGDYLGKVRRDDTVPNGYAGRWVMGSGLRYRDASGRQVHPTAMSETRDDAVAEALAIRARHQDAR